MIIIFNTSMKTGFFPQSYLSLWVPLGEIREREQAVKILFQRLLREV
jgi:hypothetical protein